MLFIITFITSIPALALYQPVLDDPAGYIAGGGEDAQIYLGVLLELLLIIANVGTAVVLYPIVRRQNEILSIGYVTARVMECVFIAAGILFVLGIVSLRQDDPNASALAVSLAALKDWTFLLGPGFIVGWGNGLILGYLMYSSRLVPRGNDVARTDRRASHHPLGDRRAVRRLGRGRHRAGPRDGPGVPVGAVARRLLRREGIQTRRSILSRPASTSSEQSRAEAPAAPPSTSALQLDSDHVNDTVADVLERVRRNGIGPQHQGPLGGKVHRPRVDDDPSVRVSPQESGKTHDDLDTRPSVGVNPGCLACLHSGSDDPNLLVVEQQRVMLGRSDDRIERVWPFPVTFRVSHYERRFWGLERSWVEGRGTQPTAADGSRKCAFPSSCDRRNTC